MGGVSEWNEWVESVGCEWVESVSGVGGVLGCEWVESVSGMSGWSRVVRGWSQ